MKRARQPQPCVVDFETFKIEDRPDYPPVPVGVSIKWWGKKARYYAWGHRTGNNSTFTEAKAELLKAWKHPDGVLFHNSKFDLAVAEVHMGLPPLAWDKVHETMFLLFLHNPHAKKFGLKEAAEELLGLDPEERDAVADWLVKNQPVPGVRISRGKQAKHPAGAYIAFAPAEIVGPYANGDVDRTEGLFRRLWKPTLVERGMSAAYDRERRLMPVLVASERNGVRVDLPRLERDVALYDDWMAQIDKWVRKRLGDPTITDADGYQNPINLDANAQLANAMIAAGVADPALMGITPGGAIATNKEALKAGVTDKILAAVLQYRAQLSTCLNTFMRPWMITARRSGGFIYTNWNQVKAILGTRTGRLSSNPNFQNMPKEFAALFAHEAEREEDPARRKELLKVKSPWGNRLPSLPLCRGYIIPYEDGHIIMGRDYSQQEPRILAHFEDGALQQQYIDDPWIDYHDNAKDHLERVMGRPYKRKPVKNINLGIIYGQGLGSLAEKNNSTVEETKEIKEAIYALYPGLKDMYNLMKVLAATEEPLITWGGREVYCEPPAIIQGRMVKFDYKMVNYLVQGSAADCTKEACIRFFEKWILRKHNRGWKLMLQVHDEIVLSVPREDLDDAQEALREAMESVEFDVKILSEGAWSAKDWASMKDYDKKGKRL